MLSLLSLLPRLLGVRLVLTFFVITDLALLPGLPLTLMAHSVALTMIIRIATEAISRCGTDLKFVEFVPFRVGSITVRNG